jgi:NADPH-dependent ferric siderophore reductase
MPSMPKWLGDTMDKLMGAASYTVTVTEAEYLTPVLKRVRFKGDFSRTDRTLGYAVLFRVNDTDYRNYTPVHFTTQTCDIWFHLEAGGPGTRFADNLTVGDQTRMSFPRGRCMYQEDKNYHFFFGDETTMGLFANLREEVIHRGQYYAGLLELDPGMSLPERLQLVPGVIDKNRDDKQEEVSRRLQHMKAGIGSSWKEMVCYLAGNAKSIQMVRKVLMEEGISSKNIITKAYWAAGKVGL